MSRMSYVIQEIHFKSDIFFPYALYKKWGGNWRQRGAEYPKGHGFAVVPLFLLPAPHSAVQRDPGEPDPVADSATSGVAHTALSHCHSSSSVAQNWLPFCVML